MCAYVVAELCHSKPDLWIRCLEEGSGGGLMTAILLYEKKETRNFIWKVLVESGSAADGKFVKDITGLRELCWWNVKRGEDDLVPSGDTRLKVGDYSIFWLDNEQAEDVRKIFE